MDTNEEEKPQSEHCEQNYTTPFFLKKVDGTQTTVKSLKTVKIHYIHNKDTEHMTAMDITISKLQHYQN